MKTLGKILGCILNAAAGIVALVVLVVIVICAVLSIFWAMIARHVHKLHRIFFKPREVIEPRAKLTPQK